MKIAKAGQFRNHSEIFANTTKIAQLNFHYIAKFRYVAKICTDRPLHKRQNFAQ